MPTQLNLTDEDLSLLMQALSFQLKEHSKHPLTPNIEHAQKKRQLLLRKISFLYADSLNLQSYDKVPDVRQDTCGSDKLQEPLLTPSSGGYWND